MPCVPIETVEIEGVQSARTRAQFRKGLLRVWPPGSDAYLLWISAAIYWPGKSTFSGKRWWQPPTTC